MGNEANLFETTKLAAGAVQESHHSTGLIRGRVTAVGGDTAPRLRAAVRPLAVVPLFNCLEESGAEGEGLDKSL